MTTRRVTAALIVACIVLACGEVEKTLGDLPGQSHGGGSGGGAQDNPAGAGSNTAGGSAAGAGGQSDAQGGSSHADFECVEDCNQRTRGTDPSCDDGKQWACRDMRVRSDTCPENSVVASCADKWNGAPSCVESCADDRSVRPECVDGKVVCPQGSVDKATCPSDSCASGAVCCSRVGEATLTQCNSATGKLNACREGDRLVVGQCFPEGVTADSCLDLEDKPCASEEFTCKAGRCEVCGCGRNESGALIWSCFIGVC